jgi:exonuclease SbcC
MSHDLSVSQIQIRNVLGIRELEFAPDGSITTITGKNASGKTSVIDAIQAVLDGGHDATLLREGADEGEVILMLSDGKTIRKRITPERSNLSVKSAEGHTMSAPQTLVNSLIDANPVDLLTADPKDRADYLLESLPMAVPEEDLAAAVEPVTYDVEIDASGHALEAIGRVYDDLYDERHQINRVVSEKRDTISQLEESLPFEADTENVGEVSDQIEALVDENDELEAERSEALEQIREQEQEQLSSLRNEMQRKIQEIKDEYSEKADDVKEKAEERKESVRNDYDEQITETKETLATLREREKNAQQHANTRRMIEQHKAEADKHEADSKAITEALSRLDDLKRDVISNLPIGNEVTINADGEIEDEDGVPFERLNTAKQIEIATSVATQRVEDCGLVCIDGMERLDEETMTAFREWAEETDLQLIVTRVGEGDLSIQNGQG